MSPRAKSKTVVDAARLALGPLHAAVDRPERGFVIIARGLEPAARQFSAGGIEGDDLVGVNASRRLASEEVEHRALNRGHPGHAADEYELVDLRGCEAGFLEAVADGLLGALEEVVGELFQFRPGEGELDVLRPGGVGGDEGQADVVGL